MTVHLTCTCLHVHEHAPVDLMYGKGWRTKLQTWQPQLTASKRRTQHTLQFAVERLANHNNTHNIAELVTCHMPSLPTPLHTPGAPHALTQVCSLKGLMVAHMIMSVDNFVLILLMALIQNSPACLPKLAQSKCSIRRHPHPKYHSRHYCTDWYPEPCTTKRKNASHTG